MGGQIHSPATSLPGENPSTLWIGGWMCPRACPDVLEKRKISFPYRNSNSVSYMLQLIQRLKKLIFKKRTDKLRHKTASTPQSSFCATNITAQYFVYVSLCTFKILHGIHIFVIDWKMPAMISQWRHIT
jgi:hypothetical protein